MAESRFKIIPPTNQESRYRYRIEVDGMRHNAYLTYALPRDGSDRTILLVNEPGPFIGKDEKAEYERLIDRTGETAKRFVGVKNIVNRLADNQFADLPNVKIAVHKFGPVPVYVLPEEPFSIPYLRNKIDVQIGVYPDLALTQNRPKNGTPHLPFLSTKTEFVRSLNVGLGLMFQRYLEDVGEGMYDIKHHLNLPDIFDGAKKIETTLAESIKSKLAAVIPSLQAYRSPATEHERLVKGLFAQESVWIFTAKYARQFALFFLNELYQHIGIESRSDYYKQGFATIRNEFDALLGPDYTKDALENRPHVSKLSKVIRAYVFEDEEAVRSISYDDEPLWVRRFIQFARFVASLNEVTLNPTEGRIFISFHHEVPASEVLKAQINDYLEKEAPIKVQLLSVKQDAGLGFKSPIKARIWLSDTIGGIASKSTAEISSDDDKDYRWLRREAEYGLLLGKRLIYLVEKGLDESKVLADLKADDPESLIPEGARIPENLQQKLLESFTEYVRANFEVDKMNGNGKHLNNEVKELLDREARKAKEKRHRHILLGFHKQFSDEVQKTLKHIQQVVPYPVEANRQNLVKKLLSRFPRIYMTDKEAERAIINTWNAVKQRALLINGQPMQLMELSKSRYYSGTLRKILARLRPDLSKHEIINWERELLNTFEPQQI